MCLTSTPFTKTVFSGAKVVMGYGIVKYWEYYFWYTLPFGILTLPICLFISNIIDNLLVISIIYIFNFRSVIDVFTCIKLRQLYAKLIRVEE